MSNQDERFYFYTKVSLHKSIHKIIRTDFEKFTIFDFINYFMKNIIQKKGED
jgi:hypothetical protein